MDPLSILDSRRYLSEILVWPPYRKLDLQGWLDNFEEGLDRDIALALLQSHVHLDEEQIVYAVASTLHGISSRAEFGSADVRDATWTDFLNEVVFSFPLGYPGDATASGYIFGRVVERLGFDESRIRASEHLVERLKTGGTTPVIFLDDLAASGSQFIRNWRRKYPVADGESSLQELKEQGLLGDVYYLPVVATVAAKAKIESECGVTVVATYVLDPDYGALDSDTRLLPADLRPHVGDFLAKYGPRTGRDEYGSAGFGSLGLALSFHHSSPNNTLPVLQTGAGTVDWKPWSA